LVLLDELEKAHPDVTGILLQIMEEGVLTDSTGRKVSFSNAIVVMTTNAGGEIQGDGLGFQPTGRSGGIEKALRQRFTPEFLGRLDGIISFEQLDEQAMQQIARKYLSQLKKRSAASGIQLQLPEELAEYLGHQSKSKGGARRVRQVIQEQVEGPLAVFLLKNGRKNAKVKAVLENGVLSFRS
jgi:ATP-dependent Clp protease ATP-binding subunit ClpA